MFKTKLKVGDEVVVRSGNDKGASGKILSIDRSNNTAVVEGVQVRKRHRKSTQSNQPSGVFEVTQPIALSKIGIKHPSKPGRTSRIGVEVKKDSKQRIYKATKKEIK